jgi:N-acetylmuramoyl-L-alanine amidase
VAGGRLAKNDHGRLLAGGLTIVLIVLAAIGATVGSGHGPSKPTTDSPPVTTAGHHPAGATHTAPGEQALDPSFFAAGSCISFPPTSGNRHTTVFLDAGHGGQDPGAVGTTESGTTIYEDNETLPVELDTMALLRAQGFTVVVSRTRDSTVLRLGPGDLSEGVLSLVGAHDEVAARDICANDAKANVLVGIYFDWGSTPYAAGSVTTYDTARPFTAENHRLASLLQSAVLAKLNSNGWQIPNDGVLTDVGMGSSNGDPSQGGLAAAALNYDHVMLIGPAKAGYFSTPSTMPGAVIEPLYITDPFEGSIADSTRGQRAIADGIATGIEQYFTGSTG